MGLAEIKREMESLLRRIKMKRALIADPRVTDKDVKKQLQLEVRDMESDLKTFESRERKLVSPAPRKVIVRRRILHGNPKSA